MNEKKNSKSRMLTCGAGALGVFLVALGAGGYFYYKTAKEFGLTKVELANTKLDLGQAQEKITDLGNQLESERYKNSLFGGQISDISKTVGTLDKLAKTDKELLQKYSKIYFLNEHYTPNNLSDIPSDCVYEKGKEIKIHTKVLPYLQDLIVAAASDGADFKIISGFRSFGEQSVLKSGYTINYGSGANKFSADQGYSEHQLGTTIDFTTAKLGVNFTTFANSDAFKWLQDNAYRYGFVLSYPKGNTYYQFEPWHWRFVGKKLANRLHEEKENFYDLPQNKIDAYLINIFD